MAQWIFACCGELPSKGLPPVVYLPMDAFGVRHSVSAVPRADHVIHLGGFTPFAWQATPCNRVGKATEDGRELACQGLTFVDPDGAALHLDTHSGKDSTNIAQASQLLFPLLFGQAPLFKETLNWIQLSYTVYRTGSYVAPVSTDIFLSTVLEG